MFALEMLPAEDGDCLWLEYGDAQKPYRVLIDAGRPGTFNHLRKRIEALPRDQRHFELFIITHIDADHISGALNMLEEREALGVTFGEVWFNGWKHLVEASKDDELGAVQGEMLTAQLVRQKLPWNTRFEGRAVSVPETDPLPVVDFSGLKLTLLTPSGARLEQLMPVWEAEVIAEGLVPGKSGRKQEPTRDDELGEPSWKDLLSTPFKSDGSKANASSISVLAEYQGCRVLLGADAYAQDLLKALKRLVGDDQKVKLHAFKLPHHGSRGNVHGELLDKLDCSLFLISSNGSRHGHPDPEAIARIIHHGQAAGEPVLYFNYESRFNNMWKSATRQERHHYTAHYPPHGTEGLRIELKK